MKKYKWNRNFIVFFFYFAFQQLYAQSTAVPVYENSHYLYLDKTAPLTTAVTPANVTSSAPVITPFTSTITLPAELTIPRRRIIRAQLLIKVNHGDNYTYGPDLPVANAPLNFKYK